MPLVNHIDRFSTSANSAHSSSVEVSKSAKNVLAAEITVEQERRRKAWQREYFEKAMRQPVTPSAQRLVLMNNEETGTWNQNYHLFVDLVVNDTRKTSTRQMVSREVVELLRQHYECLSQV